MAKKPKRKEKKPELNLSVTFVQASDEEVRAMVRAVAELAVTHLRAQEALANPKPDTFPCDGDRGNVA